eukprot:55185-Eustigmatos_ZCMA.PRE.1
MLTASSALSRVLLMLQHDDAQDEPHRAHDGVGGDSGHPKSLFLSPVGPHVQTRVSADLSATAPGSDRPIC